ncbi:cytochrome protein [Lophiotrema nucula]|uniref:Cytochrome protein n=1 Tax=Lophiotrema nucula TaxID=690887 RepID=A0A6A5YSS4_9PLEO|nr:cytochrome protein [Lophiotrema nucula]
MVALALYRLFLSPLAHFPGPKLAALTGWYETYYEILNGYGGQFTFRIADMHRQHGPIVRINPWELHIDDPEFYDTIYTLREAFDKPVHLKWRFGSPSGIFSTPEHRLHRLRRISQEPFFAKRRINQLVPEIQAIADRMCRRLQESFKREDKPVNLSNMFTSYIADVTTMYSFNRNFDYLGDKNFESPFVQAIKGFKDIAHPCTQFPWLGWFMQQLPEAVVRYLQPPMLSVQDFQRSMRLLIRDAQNDVRNGSNFDANRTVMHGILTSNLPEEELSIDKLQDHAAGLIGAGIASPQLTLTTACYHIISDHAIRAALRKELEEAMPDPDSPLPLAQLEKLPYLGACIEEALRLAVCQMARSPRIADHPILYTTSDRTYKIPSGTPISSATWHMHHNETLFPSSFTFQPSRWLSDPRTTSGRSLRKYMVAFGKGTRNCIGMNLAKAEILIGLSTLMRSFDFHLFQTSYEKDVRVVRDNMAPDVRPDSVGIRAMVK